MTQTSAPLAGMGVVVTRPQHQADGLCRSIESHGGKAIRFPTLEICGPRHLDRVQALLGQLGAYHKGIFTSANAVDWSMKLGLGPTLRKHPDVQRLAIGRSTAQTLARYDVPAHVMAPAPFTSEALLTLPALQAVVDLRIIIFRGEGGRALLGATLEQRGAQVTYAEVYRRRQPDGPVDALLHYWEQGEIQAVVVTSSASLDNLFAMVGLAGRQWLRRTPLVLLSARTRQRAWQLGVTAPLLVASEASDTAMLACLHELASRRLAVNPISMTFEDLS